MTDKPLPRPRQVTLLGAMIMAGSIFVVLLAFDQMASLGSIEAQEAAADLISEPPGSGLGLSVDGVQSVLRVLCLITGGAAAAAAILGWQVLQRARSARLALSLIAPVLLIAGTATAGFLATVVVVSIALLWVQPTRDWFNGTVSRPDQVPTPPARRDAAPEKAGPEKAGPETSSPAPAAVAPGAPLPTAAPAPGGWPPAPVAHPYGHTVSDPSSGSTGRPGTVTAAVVTTIVSSVVVAIGTGLAILFVLAERAGFEDDVATELDANAAYGDLDPAVMVDVIVAVMAVFLVWALAAIVLAVLTVRGSNGARITLVVSSIAAALASLLGLLVVVPLLVTGACVAVAVLLLRADCSAWFAARKRA